MAHHGDELDELHEGKGRLPPDGDGLSGLGDLVVHADEVVSVHDSVDESVEDDGHKDITVVVDVRVEPVKEEDGGVVVHVEERELSPLLSQDNEDGVPKVPHLGSVEQPKQIGNFGVLLVVHVAWKTRVSTAVSQEDSLNGHVGAKHDLRDVVDKLDGIGIDGRNAGLHDRRSDEDEAKVGRSNSECRGEVGQWPTLCASVDMVRIH